MSAFKVEDMADWLFKLRILRYLLRDAYDGWCNDVRDVGLDSYHCCNGRECCCGGVTHREMWEETT